MNRRIIIFCLAFLIALFYALAIPSFASLPSSSTGTIASVQTPEQQGKALYDAGRFAEAVLVLQQAAQQYQQQGDSLRQAIVLSNLALTYQQLGNGQSAKQVIQESLDLLDDLPSTTDRVAVQAQVLDVQGRLQFTQGQAGAALAVWQQAAQLYQQLEDAVGLAANQIDQSRALQALGFYQRAIDLLVQVLNFPSQVPVSPESQPGLTQTSISLEELLELKPSLMWRDKRVSYLRDKLLQPLPASRNTAIALQALAEVLQASGSLEQAEAILQHAAILIGTSDVGAAIQLDLGNVARAQADQEKAIQYYREAANSGNATIQIRSQLNQLSLRIEQAEWEKAQALLPPIQQRLKTLPLSQPLLYAQINFANSLIKGLEYLTVDAEFGSAEDYTIKLLTDTQQQASQLADGRIAAYAMSSLGKLYKTMQQWRDAETWSQQAVGLAQQVKAPDIAYLALWQLGQVLTAQSKATPDPIEKGKYITYAKTVYDAALQELKSIRYDLTSVSQDEQFSFQDAIEPAYRERVELLLQPVTDVQPSSEDLDKARSTLEELQIAELQNFLRQACDDAFVAVDQIIEDTGNQVKDTGNQEDAENQEDISPEHTEQQTSSTAIVYPIILSEQFHVILKFPQQNELYHYSTKIKAEEVEQILDELYYQLRQPEAEATVKQLAQQVYGWLIKPGEAELRNHKIDKNDENDENGTLVFVLDGALKRIPMAVLYNGDDEQYLIQRYSIALAQSLKMPSPRPLDRENIRLLVAGLSKVSGEEFLPLESVKLETDLIHAEIPKSTLLQDDQFTAAALQSQIEQSRFQVVHLATHGKFSANQDDTFIQAADRRINVVELAQVLRTRDQAQPEPLELLVLSACQTAQGDQRAALGLSGMAVRAGARSTIGSLWSVNDRSSAALMVEFYQQWKNNPKYTKAQALRQAQLKTKQDYNSPYSWAPFVLLGSWL